MTRENKLALVVGFGLILFVGILISDHFSIARQQQQADMSGKMAVNDPLNARGSGGSFVDLRPVAPPPPINEPKPAAGQAVIPTAPNAGALVADQPRPEHHNGINDAGLPQGNSPDIQLTGVDSNGNAGREPNVIPMGGTEPPTQTVKIDPPAVTPNTRFHDVKPKETLFAICKQYYGDASLNKALAKYNKIDDPTSVKVGRRLMIPTAEELGGKMVAKVTPASTPGSATPAVNTPSASLPSLKVVGETTGSASKGKTPAAVATIRTYTVKPGDSLTAIAQKQMGSKANWRKLADMNASVIDDEDNIPVGTVLRLQ